MKSIKFLGAGFAALILASCQQSGSDMLSNGTPADSLVYFFGQMRGEEYKRMALQDTTFNTQEAKDSYIAGIRAGLSGVKVDDEAYNRGFMLGTQMAITFKQFEDDYGVAIDDRVFTRSVDQTINSDSVLNGQKVQSEFYRLMNQFQTEKAEKEKEAAVLNMSQVAKKMNLPQINDELYGQVTNKTDGEKLKEGDDVTLELKATNENGEDVRIPIAPKTKVGSRTIMKVVNDALLTLNSGETGQFVSSAHFMLGNRASQANLEASSPIIFTLTATVVPTEEKKEN